MKKEEKELEGDDNDTQLPDFGYFQVCSFSCP